MANTIAQLKKELAAREKQVDKLRNEREKLAKRLSAIDRELAKELGGSPAAPSVKAHKAAKRRLPKNAKPLGEYVADALKDAPNGLRVKEIADAVKAAGYKSFAKDFYNIVATALQDKRFKKVSRGVYVLDSGAAKKTAKKAKPKAKK